MRNEHRSSEPLRTFSSTRQFPWAWAAQRPDSAGDGECDSLQVFFAVFLDPLGWPVSFSGQGSESTSAVCAESRVAQVLALAGSQRSTRETRRCFRIH